MNSSKTLFYREAANCSLVFASSDEAERVHQIHTAIETARTWGEFRDLMPDPDYQELVERFSEDWDEEADPDGPMPPDNDAFDSSFLPGYCDGDYPDWLQTRAHEFVPRNLLEQFGWQEPSVLNGNYWCIDPENEAAIVLALGQIGIRAVKRQDLKFW